MEYRFLQGLGVPYVELCLENGFSVSICCNYKKQYSVSVRAGIKRILPILTFDSFSSADVYARCMAKKIDILLTAFNSYKEKT